MLYGLRAGWGRSRAAAGPGQALCDGCSSSKSRALGGEPELEAEAGAGGAITEAALAGWDEAGGGGGRLWGQVASRGDCCYCCCGEEAAAEGDGAAVASSAAAAADWGSMQLGGAAAAAAAAAGGMAAPPPGYPLSDPGSNSERSADSPSPDDDASAGLARAPSASPEWGEERFRVDRKKLEAMLQGEQSERRRALRERGRGLPRRGGGGGYCQRRLTAPPARSPPGQEDTRWARGLQHPWRWPSSAGVGLVQRGGCVASSERALFCFCFLLRVWWGLRTPHGALEEAVLWTWTCRARFPELKSEWGEKSIGDCISNQRCSHFYHPVANQAGLPSGL